MATQVPRSAVYRIKPLIDKLVSIPDRRDVPINPEAINYTAKTLHNRLNIVLTFLTRDLARTTEERRGYIELRSRCKFILENNQVIARLREELSDPFEISHKEEGGEMKWHKAVKDFFSGEEPAAKITNCIVDQADEEWINDYMKQHPDASHMVNEKDLILAKA